MGIVAAMEKITDLVVATVPIQRPNEPFTAIDAYGAAPKLERVARTNDRCFDVGTTSYPEDDGEAGALDCNGLRVRVELAIRVGYRLPEAVDRRHVDGMIAEDIRRIVAGILKPAEWDYPTTGILSILPPEQPTNSVIGNEDAIIVTIPLTLIYREET